MSERATELTQRFNITAERFALLVERSDNDIWRLVCAAERWPVGVVAQHVALAVRVHLGWLRQIVAGDNLVETTRAELDQANAHYAERFATVTQEQVLRTLRRNVRSADSFLTALDDDALGQTAQVAFLGNVVVTVDQLIEHIFIGHITGHMRSIVATLPATDQP
jgi:hypothetical protein